MSQPAGHALDAAELDEAELDEAERDGDDTGEDFEPPLNPILMTLSTIGLFIGFVAFVAVCIPMWITGSGH